MSEAFYKSGIRHKNGGLAQLARALDLHSRGQGFDSLILHTKKKVETILIVKTVGAKEFSPKQKD